LDRVIAWSRIAHGAHALQPELAEVARGLLESRPALLLLGGEHQARLERGQPRFPECTEILGVGSPSLTALHASALLRIDERSPGNRERRRPGNDGLPHVVTSTKLDHAHSTNANAPRGKLKLC